MPCIACARARLSLRPRLWLVSMACTFRQGGSAYKALWLDCEARMHVKREKGPSVRVHALSIALYVGLYSEEDAKAERRVVMPLRHALCHALPGPGFGGGTQQDARVH